MKRTGAEAADPSFAGNLYKGFLKFWGIPRFIFYGLSDQLSEMREHQIEGAIGEPQEF
jgi:hypothetical protein